MFHTHKNLIVPHALTSRVVGLLPTKAGLQTFLHSQAPSRANTQWRMSMLRSHNGVHCCGTVGDSHSRSQLIAAKRTFTGESQGRCSPSSLFVCKVTAYFGKTARNQTFFFLKQSKKVEFRAHFGFATGNCQHCGGKGY